MKLISNRKWNIKNKSKAEQIKGWLISNGCIENQSIKSQHEVWRIRYSDATFTFYKTGILFVTDSDDAALKEAHDFIDSVIGPQFILSEKQYLIGFDETGKGEVIGHTVLTGVILPVNIFSELERVIGVAYTKVRHTVDYWDSIFRKIDFFRNKGLNFLIEKIPPWQIDKYNINKILDITYQRMILSLTRKIDVSKCRVVLDDYGIGRSLDRYLRSIKNAGAEVIKASQADEQYLESRLASLIAKREQQKVIEAIIKNPEFQIPDSPLGSGNAGDPQTLAWLKRWHAMKKEWPWFVKKSFKTIRETEGIKLKPKKLIPSINEHLISKEFREKFDSGKLEIETLSIVCPCGAVSKAVKLIRKEGITTPICISCGNELPDVALTLRYYCGRIIPDTSAILRGSISKDLRRAKFFEGFNFLLHPTVRKESDSPGGKRELERLGHFNSIGRIRLEQIRSIFEQRELNNISRDESILEDAKDQSAIILTADKGMKGSAQAKGLFVLEL